MRYVAFGLCLVVWLCGCISTGLVTFPPAKQITTIDVFEGPAAENGPHRKISDPRQIKEILAFLHDHEGKWDDNSIATEKGKYHIKFVGNDIQLWMRTGNGVLQVQGADYGLHYKELSEEEQDTLLSLLAIPRVAAPVLSDLDAETQSEAAPVEPATSQRVKAWDDPRAIHGGRIERTAAPVEKEKSTAASLAD